MSSSAETLFAVLGDIHGQFENAWLALDDALTRAEVDPAGLAAIFAVGDVEALRSDEEMGQVHGPEKYRELGDFAKVAAGALTFPAPLYFVAGNHDPYVALDADGGLVRKRGRWADGVFYLGRAGAVDVAGLRVAFLSGIHSPVVSRLPAAERPLTGAPKQDRKRRTYWVDEELRQVRDAGRRKPVDLLITHDWPSGVGTDRFGTPVGCEHVRSLIEAVEPTLSCHGHMHHPVAADIGPTTVCCLDHVRSFDTAVGVFHRNADASIDRLA